MPMRLIRRGKRAATRFNWWTRVFIGPVAVRFALLFAFFALALAAYSFATLVNRVDQQTRDRRAAITANAHARQDDCSNLNRLRTGLRGIVVSSYEAELPIVRKILPQLPPRYYAIAARSFHAEMALFAPVDCAAYGRRALP